MTLEDLKRELTGQEAEWADLQRRAAAHDDVEVHIDPSLDDYVATTLAKLTRTIARPPFGVRA